MNREPVLTVASITAAVTAVLTLIVSFGLPLTGDQQAAILSVVAILAPLVVTYARQLVTPAGPPFDEAEQLDDDAVDDGPSFTPDDGRPDA